MSYIGKYVLSSSFSNDKTTNLLTLLNVESIKWFKLLVLVWLDISDLYLFHLIVNLDPVFNCSNNLLSTSVGKVTTEIYNFVSFILSVAFVGLLTAATTASLAGSPSLVGLLVITIFSDQLKITFISQLINSISRVFQKLLKCFSGTTIPIFFSVMLPSYFPVIFIL